MFRVFAMHFDRDFIAETIGDLILFCLDLTIQKLKIKKTLISLCRFYRS